MLEHIVYIQYMYHKFLLYHKWKLLLIFSYYIYYNQYISNQKEKSNFQFQTPQVGFEPTTYRLTADRSTAELLRKIIISY
jgi:hypothetical protein